ncbi:MAG: GspE/PulE family protein [Patescibacteria group bacterium]
MVKAIVKQYVDLLHAKGLVNDEQHAKLLQGEFASLSDVDAVVRQQVVLGEEDTTQAKAELYNVEYASLIGKSMTSAILNLLPHDLAENYKIVVFEREGNRIKVGLVDPGNFRAIEAVDFMAMKNNFQVQYFTISLESYRAAAKQYETLHEEVGEALDTAETIFAPKGEALDLQGKTSLDEMIKSAPVTKIISVVLRHAIEGRASDIHIEPVGNQSRIRYRIDGILHTTIVLPIYVHSALISRIKVMASLKIDETRVPQDGRIRLNIFNKDIDFRIATIPLLNYEKVVMRILSTPDKAPTFQDLGFRGLQLDKMERNINKPNGMFLVTGPTGSGKSTTLFAGLSRLNIEGVNITTLEDPVEYFVLGVNQSAVRPEVGFTFANGLRALLRQDPDIIMVGEIRDNETASLAIQASLTGHFLLSTLHTNSALGAIPRLYDMKVEPFLLANTLNLVVAQRLIRKLCAHCKAPVKLSSDLMARIEEAFVVIPEKAFFDGINLKSPLQFFRGVGCPRCGHSGYSGRSTIAEAADITKPMKDLITTGFRRKDVEEELKNQDFITMKQDGIIKAMLGVTSVEEVLMVSEEK